MALRLGAHVPTPSGLEKEGRGSNINQAFNWPVGTVVMHYEMSAVDTLLQGTKQAKRRTRRGSRKKAGQGKNLEEQSTDSDNMAHSRTYAKEAYQEAG